MPAVLSTIAGAPFEALLANGFFSVCFTSATADNANPLSNDTAYALSPRYVTMNRFGRGPRHQTARPPTADNWVCVRRIILDKNAAIVSPYNENCSVDDAQETEANWRLIRSVGTNGRILFVIEDGGEYFFDGAAGFDASRGELWLQVLRGTAAGKYSLRLTTTGEFLRPSLDPFTFTLLLSLPPAMDVGDVGISMRIRSTTPSGPHPAGSTYYLRSYYGGLLHQTIFNNLAAYHFTSEFAPQPPVGARIGFVKVASSDAAGGNQSTYIVYFLSGKVEPNQASPAPVYMGIDANGQLQHYSTALPSDKKFHFQVRHAGDTFPNVPDSVGLFTLYHAQSNKYLTSGAVVLDRSKPFADHRYLLKVADPPAPFTLPANDAVAVEHHHMLFELMPDCLGDYAPHPSTENNIAPPRPPSCSEALLDLPRHLLLLLGRPRGTPSCSESEGPQDLLLDKAGKAGEGLIFVVDITDCPAASAEPTTSRRPPPHCVFLLLCASLACALLLLPLAFVLWGAAS